MDAACLHLPYRPRHGAQQPVLAGVGLFSGAVWARTLGVIIAAVSILANFAWLPYYPIWAVVIIAFDFFVIWALTGHGRDITMVNDR